MDQTTGASAPSKATCMHYGRHIVVEAKQRPLCPGHCLPDRIVRRIPQPSSLWLPLLSLSVQTDLQEPRCCLWAIPRVPSTFQGLAKRWVTRLLQQSLSVFARLAGCPGHTVPRGHCSLSDATVGTVGHFCAINHKGRPLGLKGCLSASWWLSAPPFYGRQAKSGLWDVLGASLRLTLWVLALCSENGKFWPGKRPGRTTNWGTLPPKKSGLWMAH